jgi:hypothetical protein
MDNTRRGRGTLLAAPPELTELLDVARESKANGWPVIPLAYRDKGHIPARVTGYHGRDLGWGQLRLFIEHGFWTGKGADRQHHDCGGLAFRMPPGVIGIDVDAYKPEGMRTLRELERQYGPLPSTYMSTSRDDGRSGIWFYRVPVGVAYAANPGDGIEVIQRHHRYAIVYPSIHEKTGEPYQWRDPGGRVVTGPPEIGNLTWLPGADDE